MHWMPTGGDEEDAMMGGKLTFLFDFVIDVVNVDRVVRPDVHDEICGKSNKVAKWSTNRDLRLSWIFAFFVVI